MPTLPFVLDRSVLPWAAQGTAGPAGRRRHHDPTEWSSSWKGIKTVGVYNDRVLPRSLPARPGVRVASDEFGVELTFDTMALGKGKFHTAESSSSKWSADDDGHELLVELTC